MKKQLMTACYLLAAAVLIDPVFADATAVLQNRLNLVNSFYANFTQRVTATDSSYVIQEGTGEFWVKRPNLFNWHMILPDENILISDGKTLWFYYPFIKQVTANWLKNTTSNTPLMLITSNRTTDWQQFNVKQQGDNFLVVPKCCNNDHFQQLTITVTTKGNIENFTALEQDGQSTTYELSNQNNGPVEDDKFYFILPQGVTLDDQRR